jgi:cytoskeleton protein RodZ
MSELGTLLVRAREARGLTLEDAERDTRISRRYLQALETEQFEAIPAPVYARGFLRSYSQYLGLDPQEALALFPRDEEHVAAQAAAQAQARPGRPQPSSAVGASRPTWRSPQQQPPQQQPRRPAPQQQRQQPRYDEPRQGQRRAPDFENELPLEPMIGVDIGVAAQNRRINTDPAAQTRSLTILVVAIGAIAGVLLLAYLLSNLGGDAKLPADASNTTPSAQQSQQAGGPAATNTLPPSGLQTTHGVVPSVIGQPVEKAEAAIAEAGYKSIRTSQPNAAAKGTVIDQSPGAEVEWSVEDPVTIVVSDGPS